jgi:hypothetical protein
MKRDNRKKKPFWEHQNCLLYTAYAKCITLKKSACAHTTWTCAYFSTFQMSFLSREQMCPSSSMNFPNMRRSPCDGFVYFPPCLELAETRTLNSTEEWPLPCNKTTGQLNISEPLSTEGASQCVQLWIAVSAFRCNTVRFQRACSPTGKYTARSTYKCLTMGRSG